MGSLPHVLGFPSSWLVAVPTPSSPAPGSLPSSRAQRCQIAFLAASSFCPPPPPLCTCPLCHPPTFPSLWTGGADARPGWRDRMEGPVLMLGLLAALVVCGKSERHPILRGPSGCPPGYPTAWSSPRLLRGAPSSSLRPPSHPGCHFSLEGPDQQGPTLGRGWVSVLSPARWPSRTSGDLPS